MGILSDYFWAYCRYSGEVDHAVKMVVDSL